MRGRIPSTPRRAGTDRYPPAIAGTMLISSPSLTAVFLSLRKRMSSSLRKTLTKRRMLPCSSQMRSARPGYDFSRLVRISEIVAPSAGTTSSSLVSLRRGVGIRTDVGIGLLVYTGCMGLEGFNLAGDERFEFAKTGFDKARFAATSLHGFLGFQSVSGDAEDYAFVPRDLALLEKLFRAGNGDAAGRFGEVACRLGKKAYPGNDFVIGGVFGMAPGFLHRANRVVAVGRRADGEGLDDSLRLGNGFNDLQAFFHGFADGRTAGRLRAVDGKRLILKNAGLNKLPIGLVDFCQKGTAGHWNDGMPRQFPSQLLRDFKTHALGSFSVIRAQVDVHETPAVLPGDLRTKPVDLIVGAADADHIGPVNQRTENFALFQIGRNQNVALQARGCGIGRD